ncbi:MAG: helix-turn-helix domain-containing protein [Ignavibacteria bacterium]|nr:helix-turn-helix domain-containing protein [Ignavibacteria bacterium]
MVEFGAALRKAREASGFTLEEIYERTRIAIKHLRAIETGDFPSVPQTYVRAFIREYARIVGLDEEQTVATYNDVAEREKGIPKPPEAIDSAHLLPHLDDSIEIIIPGSVVPKHVEVQGTAEVEATAAYIPPVRKSTSLSDSSSPAIEISTSVRKEPKPVSPTVSDPLPEPAEAADNSAAPGSAPDVSDAGSADAKTATPASVDAVAAVPARTEPDAAPEEPAHSAPLTPPAVPAPEPAAVSEKRTLRSEILDKFTRPDAPPAATAPEQKPRRSVYVAKPQHAPPPPVPAVPPKHAPPAGRVNREEKRILVVGSVVVLIVIVCIYAYFHFQPTDTPTDSMVDSTGLKASLEAGKFIDSTQHVAAEVLPIPSDTAKTVIVAPETVDPKQKGRAKDDSLILEAYSSTPVWFSVRMDTTRTERGNMSTNDHRVWKARDRFMITLGDAGAMTFFLNGKQLAPFGEEGAVIKNVTISRQNLNAGN